MPFGFSAEFTNSRASSILSIVEVVVGKTTFTKLLTGELAPNSGEVEIGETVVLGCYDQLGLKFDDTAESQTVMEFVLDQIHAQDNSDMGSSPMEARKLLNQFEFSRSRWNERISVLSGGERRRLQLLSVLSKVSWDFGFSVNLHHLLHFLSV